MKEGDKVFGSPPPWTDEMHEKWLKELKELSKISTIVEFKDNVTQFTTMLDFMLQGKQLLKEVLDEQQEVISSPIRFNGVHIEKIKQIFAKYGIIIEQDF